MDYDGKYNSFMLPDTTEAAPHRDPPEAGMLPSHVWTGRRTSTAGDAISIVTCNAEGNVTWTDQQHLLGDDDQEYGLTRQQALIKFGKYLLHFRSDRKDRKTRTISCR